MRCSTDSVGRDVFEIKEVGADVAWPEGEQIPRSMREALKQGWSVEGGDEDCSNEYSHVGNAELFKTVGMISLSIEIPFRAKYKYGKPRKRRARAITKIRQFVKVGEGRVREVADNSPSSNLVN